MNPRQAKPETGKDDGADRRSAVCETGRSFVVEASAGTGKTRTLLDRILRLVLEKGPGGEPLRLSEICAITFTEKAAGEMKIRLRQHLEQLLIEAKEPPARMERAREALNDLETASVSTFHSFAVSLLKERPIDAGIDPRFTALDEVRSELFFRQTWEPWIDRALAERHPVLEKALRSGFRLDGLEELARTLRLRWIDVRGMQCDAPPEDDVLREQMKDLLEQGKRLRTRLLDPGDKLSGILDDALDWLADPSDDGVELSKPGGSGAVKNWSGGAETVRAVRSFLNEVVGVLESVRNVPPQRLMHEVVCWIKDAFLLDEWEKRKQDAGLLDFDDQVRLARDLLLKKPEVRREFQSKYLALLVDEFQDTDPIQWETVLLVTSPDVTETDVARLKPAPGRLFIVGDPKQSIYRFRNADIETYLGATAPERLGALGLGRLELTTNFRSVPSILDFVDAAFADAMNPSGEACRYQPKYLPFGGQGDRKDECDTPSVSLLADAKEENGEKRKTREMVESECRRIAALVQEANGSAAWKVRDASAKSSGCWRPPGYGDIAILLPVLTHAHVLEEALGQFGIPYVLEGGKFYYARSEVSSAVTVLRAVANPNDAVAVYGSLRSIFFGLSDEDLLRARMDGLSFDYREDAPAGSPLRHPFAILRELHRRRHERPASETFELLLQKTGAREALAVRGFQSLANLNKLGRTLRSLQGETTFSQVVNLLHTMDEEGVDESESRLMEERSNAVRILTVHKAKGLDFPIVFVAALGLKRAARHRGILVDRTARKIFALNAGSAESGLRTPRWKALAEEEKKRDDAELVRLLYVALTRARDHMVVSTHTAKSKKLEGVDAPVPDAAGTRLEPLGPFLEDCFAGRNGLARFIDGSVLDGKSPSKPKERPSEAVDWESAAAREYAQLRALLENTPRSADLTAAGHAGGAPEGEDVSRENRTPESAANRGVRLGIAFHEAMERVDLPDGSGLLEFAQNAAAKHGLDRAGTKTLMAMMRSSLASGLMEQAREAVRSGRRVIRELPFVRPIGPARVEEGKIDLLFETEDGWVLVDYKTDWVSEDGGDVEACFRDRYEKQIREYVEALNAQSVRVQAAYLLLARTGDTIRIV